MRSPPRRLQANVSIRILIVVNADWYFWSHRLPLARAVRDAGYEVVVAAAEERGGSRRFPGSDGSVPTLKSMSIGCRVFS